MIDREEDQGLSSTVAEPPSIIAHREHVSMLADHMLVGESLADG